MRVFARDGIAAAGHADVAREAGVAVPTVFAYFPTRHELLRTVVEEVDRFLLERARNTAAGQATASEKLIAILREFADSVEADLDYLKIWLNWATSFQNEIWPYYLRFMDNVIALHREIIGEARLRGEIPETIDPEMSAYLLLGAATVIIQMKVAQRDPRSIARYLETIIHGALDQG